MRTSAAGSAVPPPKRPWARRSLPRAWGLVAMVVGTAWLINACDDDSSSGTPTDDHAAMVEQGKQIFRYDAFGDEAQWTDTLKMHEVISAAVDPTTALSVGLKVDSEALPPAVVEGIKNGSVDL